MIFHANLTDAGTIPHHTIDERLPSADDKAHLETVSANVPINITGARDEPEAALANLLTALATLGLITDSTSAS